MKAIHVCTITAEEQMQMTKPRYNAHKAFGTGTIRTSRDKARDRNSKLCKGMKQQLRQYCY